MENNCETGALWSRTEKKHRKNSHLIIHFPTSERVTERCKQTKEQMSEWSSTCVHILGCSGP